MSDYKYIGGDEPMFMKDDLRLSKGTMVRCKVLGVSWKELDRQFYVLVTLAGDFLGPL